MPWATPLASQLPPIAAATTPATANRSSLPPLSAAAGKQCHPLPPQKLASLIENSKSISQLLRIHASLIRHGLDDHPILTFKLQCSYSSLNRLDYSVAVFNSTGNPDVFSYAAIIHAHSVKNLHQQALDLYVQMLTNYVDPNTFTFSAILKSCPLQLGKTIHSQALKFGIDSDTYVRTALVDVYARGGDLESARNLFDTMPERSLVSWTAMITCYAKHGDVDEARLLFDGMEERDVVCWSVMINGYTQHGRPNEALALFRQMLGLKVKPSEATIVAVLSACGQLGALESGRWVHSYIVNNGIRFNVHVGTALVDMYSKCGSLEDASLVFDAIQDKDVVAWNSMIVGYAIHGFTEDALQLFTTMCGRGVHPTDITFIGILSACAHAGLVSEGWRFFHLMKAGNWDGAVRVRTMMKDSGVQKEPGCSSIEMNNKI
ncbi:tetratricopeptide repeat (TPR)-like superfamily protein [Actinidia rufa]|uniref:Tetratricopeptide repeat (TPR)-like superfamily protein n=1 Tax=Actinidia rufa TaxID=165716 RepID=A0A7J0H7P8_9ERIC|nr:tetratricopeptide repeat (TPR)-like superfamily protein [Actinidia rufa]